MEWLEQSRETIINETTEIIERYADMLMRVAYQNTLNQSDAEDVVQEAFIKFFQRGSGPRLDFCDEQHIKAWLLRVTINLCKDLKKSFWHRRVDALSEAWRPFSEMHDSIMDEIASLPKKYRNVLYLHYYEGYTCREIADILDTNENTVSSWLTRARKKLKHLVLDGGESHA